MNKLFKKLTLRKDFCTDNFVLEVVGTETIIKNDPIFIPYVESRVQRVTLRGSLDFFLGKNYPKGLVFSNGYGTDYLLMHLYKVKDVYVSSVVKVTTVHDLKYITENSVPNISVLFVESKRNYSIEVKGSDILFNEIPFREEIHDIVESFDISAFLTVDVFLKALCLNVDFFFDNIDNFNTFRDVGTIYNLVLKARNRSGGPSYESVCKRNIHDFFSKDRYDEYVCNLEGKNVTYYVDSDQLTMTFFNITGISSEIVNLSLSSGDEIPLDIDCGSQDQDPFCESVEHYIRDVLDNKKNYVIDNGVSGFDSINFYYNADSRCSLLTEFYCKNRDLYITDICNKYTTKMFEIFFRKEDFFKDNPSFNGDIYYRPDPFSCSFLSLPGVGWTDMYRSSCIPFQFGYSIYDENACELKNLLVSPLAVVDSQFVGDKRDRRLKFVIDIDFTSYDISFCLCKDEFLKAKYVSFFILFDDNSTTSGYSLDIVNLNDWTEYSRRVGVDPMISVIKNSRYIVGDQSVSWSGSVIFDTYTPEQFIVYKNIHSLDVYRERIRFTHSFIHSIFVKAWSRIKRFNCVMILNIDILNRIHREGFAYMDRVKCGYSENEKGPCFIIMYNG